MPFFAVTVPPCGPVLGMTTGGVGGLGGSADVRHGGAGAEQDLDRQGAEDEVAAGQVARLGREVQQVPARVGDDVPLGDRQQGLDLGQVAEHPVGAQLVQHRVQERLLAVRAVQVAVGQAVALADERQRLRRVQAAEQVLEVMPSLPLIARLARRFLIDAVHRLAAGYGVRQFLDIGTGLPTADNTHDVAQRVAPQSKIVYVDNDPVVLTHARAADQQQ
jgi:hypothetical protein